MKDFLNYLKLLFLCTIAPAIIISCSSDNDDNIDIQENVIATNITITQVNSELKIGETKQLVASIFPENTTDKSIIWLSSDDEVATVDANGLVRCISDGEVVIQATTCNHIHATTHISVAEPDFVIPEEMVGHWIGVEFNLKEIGSSMIYDEEGIHSLFYGYAEEFINEWIETQRGRYDFIANGDATIELHMDVLLSNQTVERTVIYGVLSNMKNIDNAYYGTFDVSAFYPDNPEFIMEIYLVDGRIRIQMPLNEDFDSITYYEVVKDNSELNNLIPAKTRRK